MCLEGAWALLKGPKRACKDMDATNHMVSGIQNRLWPCNQKVGSLCKCGLWAPTFECVPIRWSVLSVPALGYDISNLKSYKQEAGTSQRRMQVQSEAADFVFPTLQIPEGPDTQYLRSLVPKTIPLMGFEITDLKCCMSIWTRWQWHVYPATGIAPRFPVPLQQQAATVTSDPTRLLQAL